MPKMLKLMPYSFSIVITHYNLHSMAITAIDSVIQSINNALQAGIKIRFEIIVVDAKSNHKEFIGIKNYINSLKCKNIRLIHSKVLLRPFKARKKGIKASKYKYIFFLDGDDILEEKFFIETTKCIEKYPDLDIIRNNKLCFNDSGIWQENYYKLKKEGDGYFSKEELINFPNATMNNLYRKAYIISVLKSFKEELINFEDALFYFFCVIYFKPKLVECKDIIYYYRRHPQSFMQKAFKKGFNIKHYKLILDSFLVNLQFLLETRLVYEKKIISYFLIDYNLFVKRNNIFFKIIFFNKLKKINKSVRRLKKLSDLLSALKM